jgi:hypothetical protein
MTGSGNYIGALKARIKAKRIKSMAPFDEKWLLIVAQKSAWGSTMSTFAAAAHVAVAEMNSELDPLLRGSQYDRVMLFLQLEKVVVQWMPTSKWKKIVDQQILVDPKRVAALRNKLRLS